MPRTRKRACAQPLAGEHRESGAAELRSGDSPNGPREATIEQHTHHKAGSAGDECVGCHMPKIEQTIADVNVRSHTFRIIPPEATETFKIPNSCNSCHTDKTVQWAKDALKTWPEFSPWRVAQ